MQLLRNTLSNKKETYQTYIDRLAEKYDPIGDANGDECCPCHDGCACDCCETVPVPARLIDLDEDQMIEIRPYMHYLTPEENEILRETADYGVDVFSNDIDYTLEHYDENGTLRQLIDEYGKDMVIQMILLIAYEMLGQDK